MIVDVHAHLGRDYVFDTLFTAEELLESQATNGLDATIVQPGSVHTLAQACEQHDAIAALARAHPGRFYGMANPSPSRRNNARPDPHFRDSAGRVAGQCG